MLFIIRWPVALVLLLLALVALGAAALAAAVLGGAPIDFSAYLPADGAQSLQGTTWLEIGLLGGAGVFFFIAMVRLLRRTQAFWSWLFAFALFGGRWAVWQQRQGGLEATVQSLDANSFQPQALAATETPASQVTVLAAILIVGIIIFLIDAADRAYWDKQGA